MKTLHPIRRGPLPAFLAAFHAALLAATGGVCAAPGGAAPELLSPSDRNPMSVRPAPEETALLYVDSEMPSDVLSALARRAERLGIPLAVTGLALKGADKADGADGEDEENEENGEDASTSKGTGTLRGILTADRYRTKNLTELLRDGNPLTIDPRLWRRVKAHLGKDPAVPLLLLSVGNRIEALPGNVDPAYGVGYLARESADPALRRFARSLLERAAAADGEAR